MNSVRKILLGIGVGIATSVLVVAGLSAPAMATEAPVASSQVSSQVSPVRELTAAQIDAAYVALRDSSVPRKTSTAKDGQAVTTFTLPTGSKMSFQELKPEVATDLGGVVTPYLGGGIDAKYGIYVDFNRTDQGVIVSGGGAGLAAALCFIPGVGIALCVVAVSVVAAATAALAANGLCRNTMRVYIQLLGYPECR